LHTLRLENAWSIIEKEAAMQACPIDGNEKYARKERGKSNKVRGSHMKSQIKSPLALPRGFFINNT
jgi:hypothetical protein